MNLFSPHTQSDKSGKITAWAISYLKQIHLMIVSVSLRVTQKQKSRTSVSTNNVKQHFITNRQIYGTNKSILCVSQMELLSGDKH